jgi:flavin-binding protein dodecin
MLAGRAFGGENGMLMTLASTRAPGVQSPVNPEEDAVIQKIIDVVGTSDVSFAKAAEAAVKEAAKTVRNIKWAHIDSFDMLLDGAKVLKYRATAKIYFDVEG